MKWGVINLKELTDEIVQKSMDSYNSIWWVILIILLFFAITMICIIVSLAVKGTIIGQEKLIAFWLLLSVLNIQVLFRGQLPLISINKFCSGIYVIFSTPYIYFKGISGHKHINLIPFVQ